ncbi:MAG: HAMP domain-containing histidine kinase [Clostridia bacterium]|nr:HAMP domain-containing histidine kinase [Clostridia bacterium]
MYLMRRDLISWVLLLLASACWVFGVALANDPEELDVLWGTVSETVETSTLPTTALSTIIADKRPLQATTATTVTDETGDVNSPSESDESVLYVSDSKQRLKRVAGVLLCVGTVCLTCASVFVMRQKKAFLGPDGVCFLMGTVFALSHGITVERVVLGMSGVRFALSAWNIFLVFSVLFSFREIFCWITAGFSVKNCLIFRTAGKFKRPQLALGAFMLWILLAFGGGLVLAYERLNRGILFGGPIVFFGATVVLGIVCLLKYGADLDHFNKQLANYRSGLPIEVGTGMFSETEKQLLDVRARHEEAVRAAVSSERFKVELISNVSHDLRTPLTSILGYGELLEREDLSSEGKEHLRRLNLKAGYMNELVESLFELTKVSSGVLLPEINEIDLVRLLEQTVGFFDDRLSESGVVVRRNYEADTLPVLTDGTRMHRVFSNLLGNAVKYTMMGTRIYIDVSSVGEYYRIRMLNTASYEMDFEPDEIVKRFARGDKARSTNGSGLGLAIAKTYTESVGGRFYVTVDGDQFCAVTELPKNLRVS